MSCKKYQREIALWAGDDLSAGRVRRLERHLRECADCREYAQSFRRHQEKVAEAAAEPQDDELCAGITEAVMSRVRAAGKPVARRWTAMPVKAAALIAAAAVVLLSLAIVHRPGRITPPTVSAPAVAANAAPRPPAAPAPPAAQVRMKNPVVMKLLTDDPNVVFVMLSD